MEKGKLGATWTTKIEKAEKFLEKAVTHGQKVYARYKDERSQEESALKRVNIFYSNVNTLKESLFNSMPKTEVGRLHRGDWDDDPARVAALIVQRGLEYETHCAKDFKTAVRAAIMDRLVPGIGQVWISFSVDTTELKDQGDDGEEIISQQPTAGTEQLFIDTVYWEDFIYEPARTWDKVTWVGRRLKLSKKEIITRWGKDAAQSLDKIKVGVSNLTPKEIEENKFCVYEIWDKVKKEVLHIVKGADDVLDEKPDPYRLKNFFPCPAPLIANAITSAYLPITDYSLAQDQYNQLDILYGRIALLIQAVKVTGVYASDSTAIGRMLEGSENTLIPVDNWAMFAEKGGIKGMIDWYPIDVVVACLQQLQTEFDSVKAILYEVTGMSDIIRGASNQYETAAAQQIKAQFASVRMNGYQRDVAEFVTGILNIMSEMMVQLYSNEKLIKIVGNLAQADMQFVPAAVQILRDDFISSYKISIQADSLTQADWAMEKTQRTELLGFISQFLQSAVPAIESIPELGTLLLTMLKFGVMGFKGASEIEGVLDQQLDILIKKGQQPPAPKEPTPEEKKATLEQQTMQMEATFEAQKLQQEAADAERTAQLKEHEMNMDLAHKERMAQLDEKIKTMDLYFQQQENDMAIKNSAITNAQKIQQQTATHELSLKQAKDKPAKE